MAKKYIIAGGGTGGHIYPGIAIAKALEALDPAIEVEFVGSKAGLETKIVPREGYKLHLLSAGKLNYRGSLMGKLVGLVRIFSGFIQGLLLVIRTKPQGVLGVGGYASGPFVLAARILGVPTAIWEPNAHPGMANRWLAKIVDQCFVVFNEAREMLGHQNVKVVGLPVRSQLEQMRDYPVEHEQDTEFHVLSFGGSQGARGINETLKDSVEKERPWLFQAKLIHQTGVSDYKSINECYKKSVFDVNAYEYLFEMEKYYAWSDVVICRSGASTIAELTAIGKPSILIPLPTSADDHQKKNAQVLESAGAAILIEQKDLNSDRLNDILLGLKKNPDRLKEMAVRARSLYKPKAAEAVAELIYRQIERK